MLLPAQVVDCISVERRLCFTVLFEKLTKKWEEKKKKNIAKKTKEIRECCQGICPGTTRCCLGFSSRTGSQRSCEKATTQGSIDGCTYFKLVPSPIDKGSEENRARVDMTLMWTTAWMYPGSVTGDKQSQQRAATHLNLCWVSLDKLSRVTW